MSKRLDFKFISFSFAIVVVLALGVHFLHAFQVKRNAGTFLRLADQAEEQGKLDQTSRYLNSYLAYAPQDIAVQARYALLRDRLAVTPKARLSSLFNLERVLRADPTREDVRRRVVRLCMELDRVGDAREHLDFLLNAHPDDPELEQLLGQCHAGSGNFKSSRAYFENAIRHGPERLEAYEFLARLLREQSEAVLREGEAAKDMAGQADQVMAAMIAANPQSYQAYLVRARFRKLAGALPEAAQDVAQAEKLAPDQADVLLALAEQARDRGDIDQARAYLRRGCEKHPESVRMYQVLARLEIQAERRDDAIACLRQGIAAIPAQPAGLLLDLADVLIQAGKPDEADEIVIRLRKAGLPTDALDVLSARILMHKEQWYEAFRLLERTSPALAKAPDLAEQANLLVGRCCERLGDPDRAYAAYRQAATRDPLSVPACLGMATALAAQGEAKFGEAIDTYERIIPRLPAARLTVARLRFLQNLRLPPDLRRWKDVEKDLDQADRLTPRPPEAVVLRAEVLAAQAQVQRAYDLLVAARDKEPKQVEFWIALASLSGRLDKGAGPLVVLDEAGRQLGDLAELRLARIRYLAARPAQEAAPALAKLSTGLDSFPREDQLRLLNGLASANLQTGNTAEAETLWTELAQLQPNDLGWKLNLFDLALRSGNEAAMQRLPREMQAIEGTEGTLWRFSDARYAIWQASKGDKRTLETAQALLTDVVARRPRWARAVVVQGEIEDLQGNADTAIAHYQEAIKLGERNPLAIRRLVQLLFSRQRYAEAEQVAQKLSEQQPASGDMQRMLSAISLQTQEGYPRALELAQKAAADSKDYRDHLWLGQVIAAKPERQAEAEAPLRRAVALADGAPDPWVMLVQYLARTGQKEKAEAAVQDAERQLTRFPLALARCYEVIGNRDRAKELYEGQLDPQNAASLRAMASFCVRIGQTRDAEPHLRDLINLGAKAPQDAAWARRTLAIVLTIQGDYQQSRQALAVLGALDDVAPENAGHSSEDQRTLAIVLAARGGRAQKERAAAILESLIRAQTATPNDQFLLAQLYGSLNEWPRARERMLSLLTSKAGDNPQYLAHYIRSLLRRNDADEARLWLNRLEQLKPQDETQALQTLALKTQVLKAQGKEADALNLVQGYAKGKDAKVGAAAILLEQLGQAAAAEEMYRQYVAQSKRPEATLALVQFLGRQNRLTEALDLCEPAWLTLLPETMASTCIALVYTAKAGDKDQERVARWLETAVAKNSDSAVLLEQLAALRNLQGRFTEAETLYRQAIKRDERNPVVKNNLAWLLAFRKDKGGEALELIGQALELTGPEPGILDTRAVVYLSLGQPELAIKDLEEGLADNPSPTYYLHLAQAQFMAKNPKAASAAWAQAKTAGLMESTLHPLERPAYQQLVKELDAN